MQSRLTITVVAKQDGSLSLGSGLNSLQGHQYLLYVSKDFPNI